MNTYTLPSFSRSAITLREGLQRLSQQVGRGDSEIRVATPPPDEARFRRLVHRGAPRPTFKFPSIKLQRAVQCESALEREAALLLDMDPGIHDYGEQPMRIDYSLNGEWCCHVPDFAAMSIKGLLIYELKFKKDLNDDLMRRTQLLTAKFSALGITYEVLTEANLRRGFRVENAKRVLRRARHAVDEVLLLSTLNTLIQARCVALTEFDWSVDGSHKAAAIAQLIVSGHAIVDNGLLLTSASKVTCNPVPDQMGGAL